MPGRVVDALFACICAFEVILDGTQRTRNPIAWPHVGWWIGSFGGDINCWH
jgi:hypothetical protein